MSVDLKVNEFKPALTDFLSSLGSAKNKLGSSLVGMVNLFTDTCLQMRFWPPDECKSNIHSIFSCFGFYQLLKEIHGLNINYSCFKDNLVVVLLLTWWVYLRVKDAVRLNNSTSGWTQSWCIQKYGPENQSSHLIDAKIHSRVWVELFWQVNLSEWAFGVRCSNLE